jgi:hypothetical protein
MGLARILIAGDRMASAARVRQFVNRQFINRQFVNP